MLAPEMFSKGKLSVFPERIKDRKGLSQIFKGQTKTNKS
jgi:hypothetical protein